MKTSKYKITIINKPMMMANLIVRLDLPRLLPFRHGDDNHILLGVVYPSVERYGSKEVGNEILIGNENHAGVNIPSTGTLSVEDMPHFMKALQLATDIAEGEIVVPPGETDG